MFNRNSKPRLRRSVTLMATAMLITAMSGCSSILTPIDGTPASRLPPELLGVRRSEYVPVPVVMLARHSGDDYILAEGDILGVYIEGVMPFSSPASVPTPPPVNFPDGNSDLPPSLGYPVAVQEHGIVNLPLLKPFSVEGMTVEEARTRIADEYQSRDILRSEDTYPIVSLMKERENNVTVIRYNAGAAVGADGTAAGYSLKLPTYQSDVLNALTLTGGLPGFNEKNEVLIFKTSRIPYQRRNEVMNQLMAGEIPCAGEMPYNLLPASDIPLEEGSYVMDDGLIEERFLIRIPLRLPPGQVPHIRPSDVELDDGDIVMVQSRETEFFYTGGLLPGGQFPLPRDYDLDVLGAMALAGQGLLNSQSGGRGGGGGGGMGGLARGLGGTSPTMLYIIRKLPCGRTFNIAVDVQQAMNDSNHNILVQPGDTLILRFKPHEELLNFGLGTFFTFGVSELFRN
ncbi:sugar ABC transporter substrate-binding protein [Roseiconus nitratireducens]|uniref:Sugar ABC transporter substrate-binding protein n=1 Tax=Roseiconus nitratireducens TaxID=2605748 RepID=A0A5M6D6C8_9BACT|nr:polysaccharide biosynthesis/export family protein [Roseiconus nitratireducens]KAA5540745.1 sugar ABC transporter substrate-binding protein [Roseiconus nitratireducens]